MRIESLTYKRLVNLGNYNNETFEAVALLNENDDINQAATDLRQFVERQIAVRETVEDMLARHHALSIEVENLQNQVDNIDSSWQKLALRLDGTGITIEELKHILSAPF